MGEITRNCYTEGLPFGAMFVVECTNVGLSTLFKAATMKGLSYHVFMVYSYAFTALTLLPLFFIFYRKKDIPPLTLGITARFFALGISGFSSQYLTYVGIEYSSPTLASTMSTIIPAATFVLAVLFRIEKLEMNKLRSQLKFIGTIITIIGATVVVLFKGSAVLNLHSSSSTSSTFLASPDTSRSDWIIGGILLAVSYLMLAVCYIFLAKVVNEYPRELLVVFFINLFVCVIAMPISFITEPDLSAWRLEPDVRLFSCLYSGIIGGMGVVVHTWGLHVKGPVYVALFRPLSIAIAVILGVLFLGDNLYVGSIIGASIISIGFYIVIWGKSQEEAIEVADDDISEESNVPLLA